MCPLAAFVEAQTDDGYRDASAKILVVILQLPDSSLKPTKVNAIAR